MLNLTATSFRIKHHFYQPIFIIIDHFRTISDSSFINNSSKHDEESQREKTDFKNLSHIAFNTYSKFRIRIIREKTQHHRSP